jgi:hypothetical protein
MKTISVCVAILFVTTAAIADIMPYGHTTTLAPDDFAVTVSYASILDDSDATMFGIRLTGGIGDGLMLSGEFFAPDGFDGVGFAAAAHAVLPVGDFPADIAVRGTLGFPSLGQSAITLDLAVLGSYSMPNVRGLDFYGGIAGLVILQLDPEDAWFEPRFAAGISYRLPDYPVSFYVEIDEVAGTLVSLGGTYYF